MTKLAILPDDMVFFVDETGDEGFSDPRHPVFAMGGCASFGDRVMPDIVRPWRALKESHFGGSEVPLHAASLRATQEQMEALGQYFKAGRFFRFATVFDRDTQYIGDFAWTEAFVAVFRARVSEILAKAVRQPQGPGMRIPGRLVFIHEASERGDKFLQANFASFGVGIFGVPLEIERGLVPKKSGDPSLEVADFVMHAAGGQARRTRDGNRSARQDFVSVFQNAEPLVSFMHTHKVRKRGKTLKAKLAERRVLKALKSQGVVGTMSRFKFTPR